MLSWFYGVYLSIWRFGAMRLHYDSAPIWRRGHPYPRNWPSWLREASIEWCRVRVSRHGLVTWYDGAWRGGTWRGGTWRSGTWNDGTWNDGTWKGGVWNDGIWHNGVWTDGAWEYGTWNNGLWKDGIWNDGTWWGGTWEYGIWRGGVWCDGTWQDGIWYDGVWHDGTWKFGTWNDGTWNGGDWVDGAWQDGTWNWGTWNSIPGPLQSRLRATDGAIYIGGMKRSIAEARQVHPRDVGVSYRFHEVWMAIRDAYIDYAAGRKSPKPVTKDPVNFWESLDSDADSDPDSDPHPV